MVKDAEAHAEEDRKARELVEARNQGEAMIHNVRKSMKDLGDKLPAADKERIEAAIKDLEGVVHGEDREAIQKKTEALMEASHKLAEQMYQTAQQGEAAGTAEAGASAETQSGDKDNVVDAEFEEVKESKGKK